MKKTYNTPCCKVKEIAIRHMLCQSDPNCLTGGTMGNDATDASNSDNNLVKESSSIWGNEW